MGVDVLLLGPVETSRDGTTRPLPGERRRLLLALLALDAGSAVPVDELVAGVWDHPPANARHALQELVSTLRLVVGRSAIAFRDGGYVLDGVDVDLARFRELVKRAASAHDVDAVRLLRDALALRRGRPLVNCRSTARARRRAAALEEELLAAVAHRIDVELRCGNHRGVVADLTELVEAQPLREGFRAQLMRALYLCGRQAEALAVFRDGCRMLRGELGIDPGPELRALELAILQHDEAAVLGGGHRTGPSESARAQHLAVAWRTALRERDEDAFAELDATADQIDASLDAAVAAGDIRGVLRVVGGMWFYWTVRGRARSMHERLEPVRRSALDVETEDELLGAIGLSELAREAGDIASATELKRRALESARAFGALGATAALTSDLAVLAAREGDDYHAVRLADSALALRKSRGDVVGVAHALVARGAVDALAGRDLEALRAFDAAAATYDAADRPGEAAFVRVRHLAPVLRKRHDDGRAYPLLRSSLRAAEAIGDTATAAAARHGLAWVAIERHDPMGALRLIAAASDEDALRMLAPEERRAYDEDVARLRRELEPEAFAVAWNAGRRA